MALTGRQGIDLAFLKQRMTYHNHVKEETKKWLWEILNSLTQVSNHRLIVVLVLAILFLSFAGRAVTFFIVLYWQPHHTC